MRILFVTNRFPGMAMRGDQQRALQQLRHLAARHAITLLSFEAATAHDPIAAEVAGLCERVLTCAEPAWRGVARALPALFSTRPLQAAMFDSTARRRAVDAALASGPFDLVHVQLARLGAIVEHVQGIPCVLDLVDALSLNMARRAAHDVGAWRILASLEARRLVRYERDLCARATAVAVCSMADRAAIGEFANLNLVENGVDLDQFAFDETADRDGHLVFVGNLGYFPNVDAVHWFVDEVLPLLRQELPLLRLKLVGARPSASVRRLARHVAGIDLVGPVADVRPYLTRAAVALVPLRAGSGQQLKLLEAMAVGTPCVATSIAATGIDARDREHLLIADDAAAQARAIRELLHDPTLARAIALRARAFVELRHSWGSSADALEQVWQQALARAG